MRTSTGQAPENEKREDHVVRKGDSRSARQSTEQDGGELKVYVIKEKGGKTAGSKTRCCRPTKWVHLISSGQRRKGDPVFKSQPLHAERGGKRGVYQKKGKRRL